MAGITLRSLQPMHHWSLGKAHIMAGLFWLSAISFSQRPSQSGTNTDRAPLTNLTISFLHHLGILMCIFEDWLDIAKGNSQYCQPYIAFDPSAKHSINSKSGHVLVTSKSAMVKFEHTFEEWKAHFTTTFGATAICSSQYLQEEAFTYELPPFVLPQANCSMLNSKWTAGNTFPNTCKHKCTQGTTQLSFSLAPKQPQVVSQGPSPPTKQPPLGHRGSPPIRVADYASWH